MLLQPLVQRPGLWVEPQCQLDVAVWLQGIEAEHVGQVLGAREATLLVVLRGGLGAQGGLLGLVRTSSTPSMLSAPLPPTRPLLIKFIWKSFC